MVIYAGDFNTERGDLPHRVITELGDFDDNGHLGHVLSYGDARNSYTGPKSRPSTIDFVMHRVQERKKLQVKALRIWNPMEARVKGKDFR